MKKITTSTIGKAIYESLKDKKGADLSDAVGKVVSYLNRKKLLSKSKKILKEVKKLEYKDKGILEVNVKTPFALSENTKKELSKKISSRYQTKNIEINEAIEAKLLDGLVIEVGEEVIDLSAKGRIKKLENYLISKI